MRAVAREADVALGLVNYYYADKVSLIRAALHRIEEQDVALVEPDPTLPPEQRLRAALRRVADPEFLTTEYLSLRLQLWALAQAHEDFAQINIAAQQRYRAGLAALISAARPGLSASECDTRAADIDVVQNGIWLTALLGLDHASIHRSVAGARRSRSGPRPGVLNDRSIDSTLRPWTVSRRRMCRTSPRGSTRTPRGRCRCARRRTPSRSGWRPTGGDLRPVLAVDLPRREARRAGQLRRGGGRRDADRRRPGPGRRAPRVLQRLQAPRARAPRRVAEPRATSSAPTTRGPTTSTDGCRRPDGPIACRRSTRPRSAWTRSGVEEFGGFVYVNLDPDCDAAGRAGRRSGGRDRALGAGRGRSDPRDAVDLRRGDQLEERHRQLPGVLPLPHGAQGVRLPRGHETRTRCGTHGIWSSHFAKAGNRATRPTTCQARRSTSTPCGGLAEHACCAIPGGATSWSSRCSPPAPTAPWRPGTSTSRPPSSTSRRRQSVRYIDEVLQAAGHRPGRERPARHEHPAFDQGRIVCDPAGSGLSEHGVHHFHGLVLDAYRSWVSTPALSVRA